MSVGATRDGRPAGSAGLAGVYSFNGNKIVTTSGGGAIVTDDRGLAERARKRAQQSREKCIWYEHREVGYNYRLSNILAAIGLSQLDRLPAILKKRKANYDWYARSFKGDLLSPTPGANHWLTVAVLSSRRERDRLLRRFEAANIEARPVWKPLHLQPVFVKCRVFGGEVAEALFERGVCLPSGTGVIGNSNRRAGSCVRASRRRGSRGFRRPAPQTRTRTVASRARGSGGGSASRATARGSRPSSGVRHE